MGTSNISRTGISLILILLSACSSAKKAPPSDLSTPDRPSETMGPPEPMGPQPPVAGPDETYGPRVSEKRPITLILGPGMARAFAAIGVIKTLSEAKVPIGGVIGVEMGAIIGAAYALKGNTNSLDWALLKAREDTFAPSLLGL